MKCVLLFLSFWAFVANPLFADEVNPLVDEVASALESTIASAVDKSTSWEQAIVTCRSHFDRLWKSRNRRRAMFSLMSKFGKRKELDLGMLLGMGRYGVPWLGAGYGYFPKNEGVFVELGYGDDEFNQRLLLVAEVQARFFVSNPNHAGRYAHFVSWTGANARRKYDNVVRDLDRGFVSGAYWFHCRNFICFASAENLSTVKKIGAMGECYAVFQSWSADILSPIWGVIPRTFPMANRAATPLPEWSGESPTRLEFTELGEFGLGRGER